MEADRFLKVKDHTVSGENFNLLKCRVCGFVYTQDPPDKNQIGRYYQSAAYISHTDSKKGIFDNIYQLIRSFALNGKRKLIEKVLQRKQGKILDYGCGTGAFLKEMSTSGWEVSGIEPDPGAREKAATSTGVSIGDTPSIDQLAVDSFDVITLWHVLEHVHELEPTVNRFHQLIKSNGILLIAVPNHLSFDATHYSAFWAAYDVPRHLYHFTPQSIDFLLSKFGFKKLAIKPMWFDSFYVSLLSEKYKYGKMNPFSAIAVGLFSNLKALLNHGTCSSQIYIYQKQ